MGSNASASRKLGSSERIDRTFRIGTRSAKMVPVPRVRYPKMTEGISGMLRVVGERDATGSDVTLTCRRREGYIESILPTRLTDQAASRRLDPSSAPQFSGVEHGWPCRVHSHRCFWVLS
jgi:hypothetical protein